MYSFGSALLLVAQIVARLLGLLWGPAIGLSTGHRRRPGRQRDGHGQAVRRGLHRALI